jgi:hypothetical protein
MRVTRTILRMALLFASVCFWPVVAFADNCSSLTDCWGTAAAAGAAAAGAGAAGAASGTGGDDPGNEGDDEPDEPMSDDDDC